MEITWEVIKLGALSSRASNSLSFNFSTLLLITCCLLSGCLTTPSQSFDTLAAKSALQKGVISVDYFDLIYYRKAHSHKANQLHIYLEGDGQPWLENRYINGDPTSKEATVLHLMAADSSLAFYLGRPCYHHHGKGRHCDVKWWTSHRYSRTVLNAMIQGVNEIVKEYRLLNSADVELTLIGFSGGGTLATLMSHEIPEVKTLITINGNLDTEAWTHHHGYSPLTGSINPSQLNDLSPALKKIHLVGAKDENTPKTLNALHAFTSQINTQVLEYDDYDHHCCWSHMWQEFLLRLQ